MIAYFQIFDFIAFPFRNCCLLDFGCIWKSILPLKFNPSFELKTYVSTVYLWRHCLRRKDVSLIFHLHHGGGWKIKAWRNRRGFELAPPIFFCTQSLKAITMSIAPKGAKMLNISLDGRNRHSRMLLKLSWVGLPIGKQRNASRPRAFNESVHLQY